MKPAETGVEDPRAPTYSADAALLATAAGVEDPADLIVPYRLREPLAPAVAAGLEGRKLSLEVVRTAYSELSRRHEFMIVEGAGGIAVPFNESLDMAGLASALGLPLLVVSPVGLGAINGCVLTVEYARGRGLEILGILLNLRGTPPDLAEQTNPHVIARLTGVQIYGSLERLDRAGPLERSVMETVRRSFPELVETLVASAR